MPSPSTPIQAYVGSEIDLKSGSTQVALISEDERTSIPLIFIFRVTEHTGLGASAVISLGTNSPTFDNLVSLAAIPALDLDQIIPVSIVAGAPKLGQNTQGHEPGDPVDIV